MSQSGIQSASHVFARSGLLPPVNALILNRRLLPSSDTVLRETIILNPIYCGATCTLKRVPGTKAVISTGLFVGLERVGCERVDKVRKTSPNRVDVVPEQSISHPPRDRTSLPQSDAGFERTMWPSGTKANGETRHRKF